MMKAVKDSFSPGSFRPSPSTLSREDCWSEEATFTLIQAWGCRYVDLGRGNLRQKHWQEVANAVNDRHFNTGRNVSAAKSQPYRTDVQCKNRIDTLKKKYKVEKARVSESIPGAAYVSPWPFFSALDDLLRESFPTTSTPDSADNQRLSLPLAIVSVPVAPRSAIPRRPAPSPAIMPLGGENLLGFRGNLNAFAAAAAAAACPAYEDDSDGSRSRSSGRSGGNRKREREIERNQGYKEVADAIERLGQIYERVEERKRKEMVELEKQRMRFAKELECHRMQLFTEMQVRLHKLRRTAGSKGPTSSASTVLEYGGMMDFPSYFVLVICSINEFVIVATDEGRKKSASNRPIERYGTQRERTDPDVAWETLPALLKNCPKLETLVFEGLHHKFTNCAEEDGCLCKLCENIPTCLSSSPLKVLEIFKFGEILGDGYFKELIKQVQHFLETMPNLKQLVLYYDASFDEDLNQVSAQLQWHPRVASSKSKIQIISDNLCLSTTVPSSVTTKWGRRLSGF
ncbi:unnamed protein product [Thlaspi arvense]|uniref:FBD domain-containing protein n=1 Tax=Thlaspi arvense TaxID=13288 RepID=A0AAU9SG70_THLAR|nr:unnamed protein product [Thlaspi arvense]